MSPASQGISAHGEVCRHLSIWPDKGSTAPAAEVLLPVDSVVTMAATATVADPDQAEGLRGGLFATWSASSTWP